MIALRPPRTPGKSSDADAQLMLRAGQGELAAFERLVDRYYDRVLFVISHLMGNARGTEDLAQEVFLRIFRARERYEPNCKFSTWLFVIVNNVVRNARRTLSRRHEVQANSLLRGDCVTDRLVDDVTMPPPEELLREELYERLHEALVSLNQRQRTAIQLYHFEGKSYAEMAEAMQTSLCAAKALLHRARVSLRGQLEEYVQVG